jgi:type II secretory pathway component GspD/PulD (secretin)
MTQLTTLLVQLTGAENWSVAQVITSVSATTTGTTTTGTTWGQQPFSPLGITGPTTGGPTTTGAPGQAPTAGQYLGRMFVYGTGDLLVEQTPEIHARIEEVLTRLRAMTESQIYVELRYITYTDHFLESFGVSSIGAIRNRRNVGGELPPFKYTLNIQGIPSQTGKLTEGGRLSINFLNPEQTQMVIDAVKESGFAAVVQAPAITVMNTDIGYLPLTRTETYTSGFNVNATTGTLTPIPASIASGATLWVRPWITGDRRYVTLEVVPTFSVVTFTNLVWEDIVTVTFPDGTIARMLVRKTYQQPITETKSFYSRIRVPDRGTAIIAGFSKAGTESNEGGVPILINIPFFKRLFSAKTELETRVHEVFLVTATIMLPEEIEAKLAVD